MNSFFANYIKQATIYDELTLGGDQVQPHWRGLVDHLAMISDQDRHRIQHDIRQLLQENGVTYNIHGDMESKPRPWRLDAVPMIIGQNDWAEIEAGVAQRAHLLNLILADIYGEQKLIKKGLLPWGLVYSHSGFLRPIAGISYPHNLLTLYAADLGRGPDGRMWVLGDRTQAPSGTGYALENRMVTSRVMSHMFKEGRIRRLSNFFRHMRKTLYRMAQTRTDAAQVAILTPGPFNETYFEHAYLASYLGFLLVQGHDLTVRDGLVWLKTINGLQPVDVLLRRVDDAFCDPLELLDYSQLGISGLVEAVRRQNVFVANSLGSGVLENPGLMPFMPALANYFLGEDLILPSAATWWCGQPKELNYVLTHINKLIIKHISRTADTDTIFGHDLSRSQTEALRERIKSNPTHFVGQEQVSFSTVPSLVEDELEPRYTILRSFAVAKTSPDQPDSAAGGYEVMPGGLTRSSIKQGYFNVSAYAGGISRDTWVLSDETERHKTLWLHSEQLLNSIKQSLTVSSREAENLFWVGRYAERIEATARLLRTILDLYFHVLPAHDEAEILSFEKLLQALTHLTLTYPGFVGGPDIPADTTKEMLAQPEAELLSVMLDPDRVGSLVFNLQALTNAAYAVRNQWSVEVWPVIDTMGQRWFEMSKEQDEFSLQQIREQLNKLIMRLRSFSGYLNESMTRGFGWFFIDMGVRLERSQLLISLVRATFSAVSSEETEAALLEDLLTTTDNIITYRRRYRSYLHLQLVLEQILLDPDCPRSLIFQLERLQANLKELPRESVSYRLSREEQDILAAITALRVGDISELVARSAEDGAEASSDRPIQVRKQLDELLGVVSAKLSNISMIVSKYYFTHAEVHQPLINLPADIDQ